MSGFSEGQHPRVPAGSPNGGQWTSTANPKGFPADSDLRDGMHDEEAIAKILDEDEKYKDSEDERTAGALYDYIARDGYREMNRVLRKQPRAMFKALEGDYESDLGRVQEAAKQHLPRPVIVYRGAGVTPHAAQRIEEGKTIRLSGFLSTSFDPSVASGFGMPNTGEARAQWGRGNFLFEIKAVQGKFLRDSAEQEVLLPHGSKFRVVGKKTVRMLVNPGRMLERPREQEVEIVQLVQEFV